MSMVELDLRQLQYFLAVAEGLNISRAAQKLGMTQPALSRQVRAFEDSLGTPLLEREKKSISLTRAGEIMVREGQALTRSVEMSLKRFRREVEGAELRIGYAPSLASGLIEKAISCFATRYPGYWNQVTAYFTDHQIDAKVVGEFDGINSLKMGIEAGLGMAFVAGTPPGLTTLKLQPEPAPLCIAIGSLKKRKLTEWEQDFIDQLITAR
jgi:DNA-binding transcriptional LysR family regulator